VKSAVVTECSLTPAPCNRFALVQSRIRALPAQDDITGAVDRIRKLLDDLQATWSAPARDADAAPAKAVVCASRDIGAGPGLILGNVPAALLTRPRTQFASLVAQLGEQ